MEITNDNSSDKDRKMQNRFESFDTGDDDDEVVDKKKKKSTSFEASSDDKKPEKRGSIFDDLKAEKKDKSETTPEKLTTEEEKMVVGEIAKARSKDLEQELGMAEPDTAHEAEVLADAAFMEAVAEKMADGASIDAVLDDSEAEILEVLEIESEESEEIEPETEEPTIEHEPLDDETDEDDPAATTTPTSRTVPPVTPVVPPVIPPVPPIPPIPPIPPVPPLPVTPGPGPGPNAQPLNPNLAPPVPSYESRFDRSRAGDLLLGGIVGYLIGRRRGRLKTEARLLPVQEKLKNEVKDLQEKISLREQKIRRLVATQVNGASESGQPKVIERLTQRIEKRAEAKEQTYPESINQETEGRHSSEVHQARTERLGRMVLPRAETLSPVETGKKIENLTVPELLEIAGPMVVEGVSVKEMYRSGRLDATGLRRVVKEFLEGRSYDKLLSDNLKANLSPERLNDQGRATSQPDDGGIQGGGAAPTSPGFESPRSTSQLLPDPTTVAPQHLLTPSRREAKRKSTARMAIITVIASALVLFLLFNVK